jgi:hypothetical protein
MNDVPFIVTIAVAVLLMVLGVVAGIRSAERGVRGGRCSWCSGSGVYIPYVGASARCAFCDGTGKREVTP